MSLAREVARVVARTKLAAIGLTILDALVGSNRSAFGVLTYHRIDNPGARPWLYPSLLSATPADFEAQIRAIQRYFRPVSLPQVIAACSSGVQLPRRSVLVTFDDGYLDFAENAWPILRRLGVPATLFVPTGYPDRPDRSFWWDRLWASITLSLSPPTIVSHLGPLPLGTAEQRQRAATALIHYHMSLRHDEAMASVDALCEQLPIEGKSAVLGWDELRALSRDGVSLAPHSRHHPVLTNMSDAALREEIEGSRADLRAHVPNLSTAGAFAYPGGRYDDRVTGVLRELGFDLAFTTDRGTNRLDRTDPLRLRRINVGRRSDAPLIRAQLTIGLCNGESKPPMSDCA